MPGLLRTAFGKVLGQDGRRRRRGTPRIDCEVEDHEASVSGGFGFTYGSHCKRDPSAVYGLGAEESGKPQQHDEAESSHYQPDNAAAPFAEGRSRSPVPRRRSAALEKERKGSPDPDERSLEEGTMKRLPTYGQWSGIGGGVGAPTLQLGSFHAERLRRSSSHSGAMRPLHGYEAGAGASASASGSCSSTRSHGSAYEDDDNGADEQGGRNSGGSIPSPSGFIKGRLTQDDLRKLGSLHEPSVLTATVVEAVVAFLGCGEGKKGVGRQRKQQGKSSMALAPSWGSMRALLADPDMFEAIESFNIRKAGVSARSQLQSLLMDPIVRDEREWGTVSDGELRAVTRLLLWVQGQNQCWRDIWSDCHKEGHARCQEHCGYRMRERVNSSESNLSDSDNVSQSSGYSEQSGELQPKVMLVDLDQLMWRRRSKVPAAQTPSAFFLEPSQAIPISPPPASRPKKRAQPKPKPKRFFPCDEGEHSAHPSPSHSEMKSPALGCHPPFLSPTH
ncbi:unnamed protein product [Chrysoparadoxa australica]